MATGAGRQLAAQHSHSLEGWYAHIPGIKVLAPATLEDARFMLKAALDPRSPPRRVPAPVRAAFRRDPDVDAEAVARAVLATLSEGIDSGEVRKVMSVLPRELRTLWPEEATRGVVM